MSRNDPRREDDVDAVANGVGLNKQRFNKRSPTEHGRHAGWLPLEQLDVVMNAKIHFIQGLLKCLRNLFISAASP